MYDSVKLQSVLKPMIPDTAEADLGLAVLCLAVYEIRAGIKHRGSNSIRSRAIFLDGIAARSYVLTRDGGFDCWCELLTLEPDFVRELIFTEVNYYANEKRRRPRKNIKAKL